MRPPWWLVLTMRPGGVLLCPFFFHPAPHVVARGAVISSLRDFLGFVGNFALFWSCVHVRVGIMGGVFLGVVVFCLIRVLYPINACPPLPPGPPS